MIDPTEAYDAIADVYDGSYGDPKSAAEDRAIFEQLRRCGYLNGRVLDVGCGTGIVLDQFPFLPPASYVGLDPSGGMLARARAKHPDHDFGYGVCERLDRVEDQSVDNLICLYGSFSYCLDPASAEEEFYRVLRPGGKLLIMACGLPHAKRKSYLMSRVGHEIERKLYTEARLRYLFESWIDVDVVGFGWLIDKIPLSAPGWLFHSAMALELETIGRRFPDACSYQIITARRAG